MASFEDLWEEPAETEMDSDIQEFFDGCTIFLTGGTGFLGKLALEKMLRSCPGVRRIYVLVRVKKNVNTTKRFEDIFDSPVFGPLKRSGVDFMKKVSLISGDCVLPDLGISDQDKETIIKEVDCIFHFAATVRFDQKLKTATYINVRSTRDLLKLSRKMKQVKTFLYCSTAYSHCPRKEIAETFYKPRISGDQLIELMEVLDDDVIEDITNKLIGEWPNTYSFTKAAAENVIEIHGLGLPISIVRPSIILNTVREPIAGWVTFFGVTGISMASCFGLLRVLHCDGENIADIVASDFAVNCGIASAWEVGIKKKDGSGVQKPKIFNFVSGCDNPVTWNEYKKLLEDVGPSVGSTKVVWHNNMSYISNYYLYVIVNFFCHVVPAYIVDFVLRCIGRKPLAVEMYNKFHKFTIPIEYFTMRQWKFDNKNCKALWEKLNPKDKDIFNFDLASLEWNEVGEIGIRGGKLYLIKEPLDDPAGIRHLRRLKYIYYISITVLVIILYYVLLLLYRLIF